MTQPAPLPANLIFITHPEPRVVLLNVQVRDGENPVQYRITREQLFLLNARTADALLAEAGR